MARSIASIICSDGTGLVRKSSAPALMARTVVGISECPVTNTIGKIGSELDEAVLQFEAAQSGHLHVEQDASRLFGAREAIQQVLRR